MPNSDSASSVRPEPSSAGDAEDLALPHREGHVREIAGAREVLDLEHARRGAEVRLDALMVEGFAGHQLAKTAVGHSRRLERAARLAVAQHSDAFGNLENLVETMADEHDRDGPALQLEREREESIDLVPRERGGRFVHDDEARVVGDGAADRDELALGDREVAQAGRRVKRHADPLQGGFRRAPDRSPAQEMQPVVLLDRDILGNREVGEQGQVLVDDLDAAPDAFGRIQPCAFLAADQDAAARLRRLHAGDDLDQRRFARAVLAGEAVHLAGGNVHVDAVECADAAEPFRDIPQFEKARHAVCPSR